MLNVDSTGVARVLQELDAEDKVEYLEQATYAAQKAEEPPAPPTPTVAEAPGDGNFLLQCLILVAVTVVLLVIFTVLMLYVRKRKRSVIAGHSAVSRCLAVTCSSRNR